MKNTRMIPVVRGVGPRLVSTNATRNRIVIMSAMPTEPARFQCTFSKVTQKNVARKKKSATRVRLTARGTAGPPRVTRRSWKGCRERAGHR